MQKYGRDYFLQEKILSSKNNKYLETFCSGNEEIDNYFHTQAHTDNSTVIHMFIETETDTVVACIGVSCSCVGVREGTRKVKVIPVVEIKYFAVDERYQHIPYVPNGTLSLSHYILCYIVDTLKNIANNQIGAEKIVLYSLPSAVNFYSKCKFKLLDKYMTASNTGDYIPLYHDID